MIKHPQILNASNPTRPYTYDFNVEGLYQSGCKQSNANHGELTDAEIDALIMSESDDYSKPDVHDDLYGDDYADAILADLANIN